MYIKKLQLVNFQVIKEFNADFEGNVYLITGDNELGKSTLLKAIGALLTGKRDDVLRKGADKGFAKMVVGDNGDEYEVSLSFTEANPRGVLKITQKSTGVQSNNVSFLQKCFGYTDFDAVEFSRWSETAEGRRRQIEVVRGLLPAGVREKIDAIDSRLAGLYEQRTEAGRNVKAFDGYVAKLQEQLQPGDLEMYAEPVNISELLERQQQMAALDEKAKTVRKMLAERVEQLAGIDARLEAARTAREQAIKAAELAYKQAVETIESERAEWTERKTNAENWLAGYESERGQNDSSELLAKAEEHNKRYAIVQQYTEKKTQWETARAEFDTLTERISKGRELRAGLIAESHLPIEGLTFTDEGLELNGVPFIPGRVSDSQIMEVATKLIIASNPTVKVFRIARGESLGSKRLQTIVDVAKRNGFQGFIEQVQRGQDEMMVEEYTEA